MPQPRLAPEGWKDTRKRVRFRLTHTQLGSESRSDAMGMARTRNQTLGATAGWKQM